VLVAAVDESLALRLMGLGAEVESEPSLDDADRAYLEAINSVPLDDRLAATAASAVA
jgi:hypothetical protein